jgi:putative colanic acid biosynthesis acetyltransferase WcaF
VLWPWKLSIGDDCWIGEQAWLLNLEPIIIEHDVYIGNEALLCTESQDDSDGHLGHGNAPITVRRGARVAARATLLSGSIVPARASVPTASIFQTHISHSVQQ